MRFFGYRGPVKYSSTTTRTASIDGFMGGADGIENHTGEAVFLPTDNTVNLALKFNSGCFRNDLPSRYGPADLDKHLADKKLLNSNEIAGWMRLRGEPLYAKKG